MDARQHPDPEIGCIVVTQPVFLDEDDWIDVPPDWSPNIVSGKTYSGETGIGARLWAEFQEAAQYTRLRRTPEDALNAVLDAPHYGETYSARVRLGQGGFRSLVTEVYQRRCAMTGERTLPVLQASHIKPYALSGPHRVDSGWLLRADLHILFDRGYVTVTKDHRVEVSRRIKEEFENGRDYYAMHGQKLRVLPDRQEDQPAEDYVAWHNDHVFAG
jgi:putative restriction endonuclease